jgi:hypothetical protein
MWPERVLLLRSGRHLQTAIAALQARWPGCQIAVVGTAGSERAIEEVGIEAANTFIYTRRSRFSPGTFFFSTTAMAVRLWRFDRVAVLWNDPDGAGQGNVDRTAFLLAPRGFVAIAPDGTVIERSVLPQIRREARRAVLSLFVAVTLAALYMPAFMLGRRKAGSNLNTN